MIGSLYIFRTGDADAARALLEADPYYRAGFWEVINAYPLLGAAGSAVGGKAW